MFKYPNQTVRTENGKMKDMEEMKGMKHNNARKLIYPDAACNQSSKAPAITGQDESVS